MDISKFSQVYSKEQLPILTRPGGRNAGRTGLGLYDDLVNRGDWKFIANADRTESAVKHDSRPQPPCRLIKEGRKYSTRKAYFDAKDGRGEQLGIIIQRTV